MARIYPHAAAANTACMLYSLADESENYCPVCDAIEENQGRWLKAVEDTIRLGQPTWLTLPTCAKHAVTCLNISRRQVPVAIAARYIEASLAMTLRPRVAVPERTRRRRSHRWFKASVAGLDSTLDPVPEHQDSINDTTMACPGCQQIDVAMRRAAFSLLRAFSRTTDSEASWQVGRLCLKHLAEVMIYAPDDSAQRRIVKSFSKISQLPIPCHVLAG